MKGESPFSCLLRSHTLPPRTDKEAVKVKIQKTVWMLCLLMAAGLTMTFSASALARAPINSDDGGVTIKGYDTVAYFTKGKPVKGKDAFSFEWKGAKWLFSSNEHMELFVKDPEKYAPQYGGY